jgi:hypothetical protein
LIVAKLDERQIKREIEQREVYVPGYEEASSELNRKLDALRSSFGMAGFNEKDIDDMLLRDVKSLRRIAINSSKQQPQASAQ